MPGESWQQSADAYADVCVAGPGAFLLAGLSHEHLTSPWDSSFEPASFISFDRFLSIASKATAMG